MTKRSALCKEFLNFLYREGFIYGFRSTLDGRYFIVYLKYYNGRTVLPINLKTLSRKSGTRFFSYQEVKKKFGKYKWVIIYNPIYGFLFLDQLQFVRVGGEVLFVANG
jgi:ribosomal protein S8